MTCERLTFPDGAHGWLCQNDDRVECVCSAEATKFCDAAVAPGVTCDAPICDACATPAGWTRPWLDIVTLRQCDRLSRFARIQPERRAVYAGLAKDMRDAWREEENDTIDHCPKHRDVQPPRVPREILELARRLSRVA